MEFVGWTQLHCPGVPDNAGAEVVVKNGFLDEETFDQRAMRTLARFNSEPHLNYLSRTLAFLLCETCDASIFIDLFCH